MLLWQNLSDQHVTNESSAAKKVAAFEYQDIKLSSPTMIALNSWGTQEEYNQQCNYYITVILQSGLLLDEDIQALSAQYVYNYDSLTEARKLQVLPMVLSGVAALNALYWLKKGFVSIASACATPAIGFALIWTAKAINKKRKMRNVEETVEGLKEIVMLNKLVIKYLRERIVASKSYGDGVFVAYTSRIEEMVKFIVNSEIDFLKQIKEALIVFSRVVGEIKESYLYLNQIDLDSFRLHSAGSAEECITFYQRFSGMFILHVSHGLSCLGLALCPSLWFPHPRISCVFDATSALKNVISEILPAMKARFNAVKFDLHRTLCNGVSRKINAGCKAKLNIGENLMHAAFILEQANGILEKMNDDAGPADLQKNLESLRDSTFNYYEKLNLLCQVCNNEVAPRKEAIRQVEKADDRNDDELSKSYSEELPVPDPTSDDDVYELDMYQPDNDGLKQNSCIDVDDSASVKFASLMVQELKQSLKTDHRFLAAREKRGIIDEEPTKHEEETVISPKYPAEVKLERTFPCPAPPPPPLPSSSLITTEDSDDDGTASDFLKAIRGEYSKRNIVVDLIEDHD